MSLPATIPEALFATAGRGAGEYVFHLEEGPVRLPCAELAERASAGARRLAALGVEPGDAVGLLGPNRPEWVVWAFATWLAGAVLVPIQIPIRLRDPAAFAAQLRSLVAAAGCRRVLADPALAPALPDEVAVGWGEGEGDRSAEEPEPPTDRSAAVIQFTSGSTASPKGALLTHRAVMAQMDILDHAFRKGDETRTTVSWTPYFHDMGLFHNVIPASVWGLVSNHLPTERFARDPAEWLRLVEASQAALTAAPSSAFGSAIRAADRRDERPDLSSLEICYFVAEGVDPKVAERIMVDAEARFQLPPESLGSTYGMAEAVLAVSYPPVGTGMRIDRISLEELVSSGRAAPAVDGPARLMVSCGPPARSMQVRIVDPALQPLPERGVGEILVRGPSLMSRYVGPDAPDPFVDGWLRTGDLGYMAGGELYVTGRLKDMVIVTGHNYYPEDFEWAAARVDAVRPGRSVAFNLPGTEEVVVLVEAEASGGADGVGRAVRRSVADAVGVAPSEVVVLPRDTIEKTTSGKLRRAAMRDAYLSGALGVTGG